MNPPLTRLDLDSFRCEEPGCATEHVVGSTPLVLRAKCHDTDRVLATYSGGVLLLECHKCGEMVARVAVAP